LNSIAVIVFLLASLCAFGPLNAVRGADAVNLGKARPPNKTINLPPNAYAESLGMGPRGRTAYVHVSVSGKGSEGGTESRDLFMRFDLQTGVADVLSAGPRETPSWYERLFVAPDGAGLIVQQGFGGTSSVTVCQHEAMSGKLLREFPVGPMWMTSGWQPAISPDSKTIYLCHHDKAGAWVVARAIADNRDRGRKQISEDLHGVRLFAVDEHVVIVESDEPSEKATRGLDLAVQVSLWDSKVNRIRKSFHVPDLFLVACSIEPPPVNVIADSLFVVVEGPDADRPKIEIWSLKTGTRQQAIIPPDQIMVCRVQGTQDGRLLLVGGQRRGDERLVVLVYDLRAKRWIDLLDTPAFGFAYDSLVTDLNLSADGRVLAAIHDTGAEKKDAGEREQCVAVFDLHAAGDRSGRTDRSRGSARSANGM